MSRVIRSIRFAFWGVESFSKIIESDLECREFHFQEKQFVSMETLSKNVLSSAVFFKVTDNYFPLD